jgi:hypothetical protein
MRKVASSAGLHLSSRVRLEGDFHQPTDLRPWEREWTTKQNKRKKQHDN